MKILFAIMFVGSCIQQDTTGTLIMGTGSTNIVYSDPSMLLQESLRDTRLTLTSGNAKLELLTNGEIYANDKLITTDTALVKCLYKLCGL